jgi:radical SAM protein (TIGR01212 family)
LKTLYENALIFPDVVGLVIGTRPDTVDDPTLDYLTELAQRTFVQVEYGIESCYDRTLKRINRGHDFATAEAMILKSAGRGFRVGAHMIFGLPGETPDEMLKEAEILSNLPIDSIKFHQLQIVKGTQMEKDFLSHPDDFFEFSLEDYIDFVIRFIERLNPKIVVERFAGEVPPPFLHHSSWDLIRYDEVLRLIEGELDRRDTWQGRLFENNRIIEQ